MAIAAAPLTVKDYRADTHNNWCPGVWRFWNTDGDPKLTRQVAASTTSGGRVFPA